MVKHKLLIGLFVVIVGAGMFLFVALRPPVVASTLRSRSQHFPALTKKVSFLGYQWHPDGYLVFDGFDEHGQRDVYKVQPRDGAKAVLFHNVIRGNGLGNDDAGVISADGRWRIATMEKLFIVSSMDGKRKIAVPNKTLRYPLAGAQYYDRTVAWMPDSLQWVELANENGQNVLLVRQVDSATPRRIPIGASSRDQSLLGITPDNRAILTLGNGRNSLLLSVPLTTGYGKTTVRNVTPPQDVNPIGAVLSPDGQYIAWRAFGYDSSYQYAVSSFFRRMRGKAEIDIRGIWLTRSDGTGWRPIGSERFPSVKDDMLTMLRFTPDGKRLSYVFGGEFYTVRLP